MQAATSMTSADWASVAGVVVLLLALVAALMDRQGLKRRLHRAERASGLLETDLAAARQEVATLIALLGHSAASPEPTPTASYAEPPTVRARLRTSGLSDH